jgi:hypothetical protein
VKDDRANLLRSMKKSGESTCFSSLPHPNHNELSNDANYQSGDELLGKLLIPILNQFIRKFSLAVGSLH